MTAQELLVLMIRISIILTVFGFGLQATMADVLYLYRRPSLLARSLVAMFVVMPVAAIVMAKLFDLRPSVEIILTALAISPLPPLLPRKETKGGGHTPYALGLMVIIGVLSIAIVPIAARLVGVLFGQTISMSAGAVARITVTMVVLPLAAGLIVRASLPTVAERVARPAGRVAGALLAISILVILVAALPAALALIGNGTLVAMLVFVVVGLIAGHLLGRPQEDHETVLAVATGARHPAIALAIARGNFPDEPDLVAALLLYLLVSAAVGAAYMAWQRRQAAGELSTAGNS
jgi:BASS family bile acid:Na+ symporter